MLKHQKRARTSKTNVYELLKTSNTRYLTDGISNSHLWTVVKVLKRPLYYHLFVDVGTPSEDWRHDEPSTTTASSTHKGQ